MYPLYFKQNPIYFVYFIQYIFVYYIQCILNKNGFCIIILVWLLHSLGSAVWEPMTDTKAWIRSLNCPPAKQNNRKITGLIQHSECNPRLTETSGKRSLTEMGMLCNLLILATGFEALNCLNEKCTFLLQQLFSQKQKRILFYMS